jgi:hypothetical protein
MANIIKMWKMQLAAAYTYCLYIICYIGLTKPISNEIPVGKKSVPKCRLYH